MTPTDICVCGNRRDQHKDGMWECQLNELGHHGASACHSFRLASHAPEDQPPVARFYEDGMPS